VDINNAASDQCANTDPTPTNTSRYPGATSVPTAENNRAPKGKRTRHDDAPTPDAPGDVMAVLRHGGTAALACAAASSAVSLYWLAILVGWPAALAWLLPASLDVYAGTSLYVGYRLPVRHPAARTARRNARFALSLSVACNAIYHALVLFGTAWPTWVHDSLLVAVSALPPIVVERLLHLRSKVDTGTPAAGFGTVPAPRAEIPQQVPRERPATAALRPTGTPAAVPPPVARPQVPVPAAPAAQVPQPATAGVDGTELPALGERRDLVAAQLETVKELVREHGPEVTLSTIMARTGCSKSTASRRRADAIDALKTEARAHREPGAEPADEPERDGEVA